MLYFAFKLLDGILCQYISGAKRPHSITGLIHMEFPLLGSLIRLTPRSFSSRTDICCPLAAVSLNQQSAVGHKSYKFNCSKVADDAAGKIIVE